jgi:N6-adenosine-specific RNA methylase IME4
MKKYKIIYADPPWSYGDKRTGAGKNNPHGAGGAEKHYKTMTPDQLYSLPIQNICEENCMLFMWATSPQLPVAINLIEKWGFKYKTVAFVWVKMKNDMSEPRGDGIGSYTLSNAEYVLVATKGKYWRNDATARQILLSPKLAHSQKPDEIRKRIVKLAGDLPRLELFAREKTEGWDVWGNEVESDISLTPPTQF